MTTLAPRESPSSLPSVRLSVARAVVLGILASGQSDPREGDRLVGHQLVGGDLLPGRRGERASPPPQGRRRMGDEGADADHVQVELAEKRDISAPGRRRSARGCRPSHRSRSRTPSPRGSGGSPGGSAHRRAGGWIRSYNSGFEVSKRRRYRSAPASRQAFRSASARSPRLSVTARGVSRRIRRMIPAIQSAVIPSSSPDCMTTVPYP